MSLLRFAAADLARNRRRTLSSITGVLLAVTFIAGTLIAIDSSSRSLLDAYLRDVPGDFSLAVIGQTGDLNWTGLEASLRLVPGVTDVALYHYLPVFGLSNPARNGTSPLPYGAVYAFQPDHLPYFLRGLSVTGSLALPNGSALMTSDLATALGIAAGGLVQLTDSVYSGAGVLKNYTVNLTVTGIVSRPSLPTYVYAVFVNLTDAGWIAARLGQNPIGFQWSGDIWIDRARFIQPYDAEATRRSLLRLERSLGTAADAFGASVRDNDLSPLDTYSSALGSERLVFLVMTAPVALLALYLGAVGVELGHAERRRELAVVRSRGASPRQILGLLLLEALLGGLVATVLGLLAGVVASRALLAVVNPVGVAYVPNYGDLFLSGDTVALVLGLSVAFMLVASIASARRTSHLPLVETLRFYAPGETRLYYSPVGDIILTAYAIAGYAVVVLYRPNVADLTSFLLTIFFYASLPIAPIFLIIGATRLATRTTGKVYELTARACRPFSRDLEYLIARDLRRNPRRASNVAVIIALGLAFGVFTVSIFGSVEAYQGRIIRFYTGSDARVAPPYNFTGSFADSLSALPGISGVTPVDFGPGGPNWGYAGIVAIHTDSYFSVARPESFYLENMSEVDAAAILEENGSVLITQAYADQNAIQVGDQLVLTNTYLNKTSAWNTATRAVVVAGIVRFLPGTGLYGFPLSPPGQLYTNPSLPGNLLDQAPAEIYGGWTTFESLWNPPGPDKAPGANLTRSVYLASLAFGADWRSVKREIQGLGVANPTMYQELLDAYAASPSQLSFTGFIRMEVVFIVLILTIGLALIVYASSREREVEFAGLIARGASGWQSGGLLIGEAFSVMAIGLIVGTAVGILSGIFYDPFLFTTLSLASGSPVIPFLFEFPIAGFLLLVGAAGAILSAASLVSWRIARMDVARVLKLRGG